MINKSVKKYLLGIGRDEAGAMLIVSFLIIVLLTIVGGAALTNSVIETKISVNFKKSASAFYIADAGIEAGKGFILGTPNLNDVLNGADNLVGPPAANDVDNGIVFTNQAISGGSYTVTVADDNDLDGNIWEDVNSTAVITSTGTGQSNSSAKIEAWVRWAPFIFPGAISFIDNNNADPDEQDEIDVNISDWTPGVGSGNVWGMVITGYDTLDGSNTPGDGPGPDVAGLAAQEGPVGFLQQDASFANMVAGGINEASDQICTPGAGPPGVAPCFHTLSGNPGGPMVDAPTGPTETEIKTMFANLKDQALADNPALVIAGASNAPWPATIGTPADPRIAVIENGSGQVDFDNDLTGYGILVIEGRLRIQATIRWHGVIYITCRGGIEMNDLNPHTFEVWGGIAMINYDDGACGGGSDEERFELSRGTLHVYYSTEAIQKYADPFGRLETFAWRELD